MAIPHLPEVRSALWEELENSDGAGNSGDVIEALARHFQLSEYERELRDPTGQRTFNHRVHSAVAQSRKVGWIEQVEEAGRGYWRLTKEYFEDTKH
jgi:restriction endonuclease Mrr